MSTAGNSDIDGGCGFPPAYRMEDSHTDSQTPAKARGGRDSSTQVNVRFFFFLMKKKSASIFYSIDLYFMSISERSESTLPCSGKKTSCRKDM